MPRRRSLARLACAVALIAAGGCATAPPRAGAPPSTPTELPRLVCGQGSRQVDLRRTGVPTDAELLDVALGGDRIWVLAEGRFLVEIPRGGGGQARFLHGRDDSPPWGALTVDPADGSLWIVSRTSFDLLHFDPATGQSRRVTVERATGPGGFSDVAVRDGVVAVTPTCSDHGVWSIDPLEGRLLDRSFPLEELESGRSWMVASPGATPVEVPCSIASLATGPGGAVYASWGGRVYRPAADGWDEVPALRPAATAATAIRGFDIGDRSETWFFENTHGFLFIGGGPVWVGGSAMSAAADRRGLLLFRRGADGELIPHLEPCLGRFARAYDSDDAGYVFLTDDGLVFGPVAAGPP